MKAIKVAGKIIGWAVGGYAILNTLVWAVVGAGLCLSNLRDAMDDDRIQNKVSYAQGRAIEGAEDGWKWTVEVFKELFELIAEAIKDAF